MLPPGFERRVITMVESTPNIHQDTIDSLSTHSKKILDIIQNKQRIDTRELKKLVPEKEVDSAITQLTRKGLITKTYDIEGPRVRPRTVTYLKLATSIDQVSEIIPKLERKRAHQQVKLLKLLMDESNPIPLPEARQRLGFSSTVVQALSRHGLIATEEVRVQRDPLAHRTFTTTAPPVLTAAQENAFAQIRSAMRQSDTSSVFLLHGVTGSGKTEIYIRALKEAIALGKRAIVLVPEIALTPQTIARFSERFPNRVAVLHSKLSLGEQFDEWHQIREGAFDVVIGSRGAIFAPQPDLGLIIIDEEHEWTYKQHEQSPRYHARDVAVKLAELTNSTIILGSATPDVVSYHKTHHEEFRLLQLPERIAAGEISTMPQVEIVDLRSELKQGNRSILSRPLAESITKALSAKEQVILFLNRRGTATFVQCRDCGYVMHCRRCDVSLTYHSSEEKLICHQCNYRSRIPNICPSCNSKRIKFLGIGTQGVAEEVAAAFPEARLIRWDRDVTKGKHSHEQILDRFLAHDADILIGTQMVAKGLDMPLVTLVGVINADIGLHMPDFRSSERTFQILAQVAGRAGRGIKDGKVIIQSYSPEHYAMIAASNHDFSTFYDQEIAYRHQQGNPPFNRLARLIYSHTNASYCQKEANRMHRLLNQTITSHGIPNTNLIGPSPTITQRIRGRYRWQIIIRCPDPISLLSEITIPPKWLLDIDPISLN